MGQVCRFEFDETVTKQNIDDQIALAIITAECTFGKPKVRLHAAYLSSDGQAALDVSSDVGEHIAQVFTGLMSRELGEENFTVERINSKR